MDVWVAELVDAHDSGSCGEILEGSTPFPDTILFLCIMKKSTVKFLIYTFVGIFAAGLLYIVSNNISSYSGIFPQKTIGIMHTGIYIAPFIGLIYWFFARELDD